MCWMLGTLSDRTIWDIFQEGGKIVGYWFQEYYLLPKDCLKIELHNFPGCLSNPNVFFNNSARFLTLSFLLSLAIHPIKIFSF